MCCIFFLQLRNLARGTDSFSKLDLRSAARKFYNPAADLVPGLMLDDVFIDAGGNQLLHAELQSSRLSIKLEHQCFHRLPDFKYILRMIDTFLSADVADVNHPLYPLGKLHERAK